MIANVAWIAVDWGTTRLRAWALGADHSVLAEAASDDGMNGLRTEQFEPALLALVGDWLSQGRRTPVLACGMVGARQGWIEADYVATPTRPLVGAHFKAAPTRDPRIEVAIIPGLMQAEPADVMRGEETQIAGLLATRPVFDGTVCMPGTHCKWVRIQDGRVEAFTTCMTGEVFALLEGHSVLRHSLGAKGMDREAFEAAALAGLSDPSLGTTGLFSVRAGDLLHGEQAQVSRGKLSGTLIASEVRAMAALWRERKVLLLGAPGLAELYRFVLHQAGGDADIVDGATATVQGLIAARNALGRDQKGDAQ